MRRALIACLLVVAAAFAAAPAYAADGDYSIEELSTEITVETNATIHVVERQTITFENHNRGLVWYLHVPEDGETVRISRISVAPVDNGGTPLDGWTRLQLVDSNPARQGRSPGDTAAPTLRMQSTRPWYSYSIRDGMVRCFFPMMPVLDAGADGAASSASESAEDARVYQTYVVETDYVIWHRVRVYRDVAELYWRYVHDSLQSDADDVNLQVQLPLPADISPETVMSEVHAWGHGPDNGVFSVGENGVVTYHIDHIAKGNYAEAHLTFPAGWMTDMAPNAPNWFSSMRGASAIEEESKWVDRSQREAAWDNNVRVLFLVLAGAIILVAVTAVLRFGRSRRARLALVRVAATFGIMALAEHLFFREPLTTLMLSALAIVVGAVSLMLPNSEEGEGLSAANQDETQGDLDKGEGLS